jgi:exodeoxyribonuclease-5
MALTDSKFQEHLNQIPGDNNRTLWEQIKDLLASLVNALGLDIKPGSALVVAIKDSLDLINVNQEIFKDQRVTNQPTQISNTQTQNEIVAGSTVYSNYGLYKDKTFEVVKLSKGTITKRGKNIDRVYTKDVIVLKDKDDKLIKIFGTNKDGIFYGEQDSTGKSYSTATTVQFNLLKPTQVSNENNLFTTKIDQFNYTYNPTTNEVIHNAKAGDKIETNDTQINKVLVQYALANNYEQRIFNGSTYIAIADRILNIKNANEVSPETWDAAKISTQSTQVKEGVQELFNSNPELANIGTQEQYSQYLDTIFPDSKVKDIVYRGGEKEDSRLFQYFTKNSSEAYMYSKANITKGGNITERNPISAINKQAESYLDNKYGKGTYEILSLPDDWESLIYYSLDISLVDIDYNLTEKGKKLFDELKEKSNKKEQLLKSLDKKDVELVNSINTVTNLYDSIKIESEADLTKPYDDVDYQNNIGKYNKARNYIDDVLGVATIRQDIGKITANVINITNPYKDEIAQEDLTNDRDAYKSGHDGAFLMDGDHFLVKSNTNQIQELGSKQDVEGFKKFVEGNKVTPTITVYELFPGVYANAGQREAIDLLDNFLQSDKQAFLLQGKGGTGKTTIIKKVLDSVREKESVLAIAPSHKAKKVLDRSINSDKKKKPVNTITLASALAIKLDESTGKFEPDIFARQKGRVPIKKASIILIDESSMVSDNLLQEIKQMMSPNAKIIFMGDRAQLPPVGQETDSKVFDIKTGYTLTEKMRQAATSPIINIGTKVSENVESGNPVIEPIAPSDRVNSTDPISGSSIKWESSVNNALQEFVEDFRKADGDVNFAKIVTFNNQNHPNPQSVKNLNEKVRARLYGENAATNQFLPGEMLTSYNSYSKDPQNPEVPPEFNNSEDLIVINSTLRKSTPITITVQSQEKGRRSKQFVFDVENLTLKNEDGKTLDNIPVIANSSKEAFKAAVSELYKTDRQMAYRLSAEFADIEYGYAITSHKAQGSTYTNVYVMEDNIMGPSNGGSTKAKNQSLYVAVSRPTTKLVMVSEKNSAQSQDFDAEGFYTGDTKENMSLQDWEDYNSINDLFDESITESLISRDKYENYLLICGK